MQGTIRRTKAVKGKRERNAEDRSGSLGTRLEAQNCIIALGITEDTGHWFRKYL
jgi:hypothetical protein